MKIFLISASLVVLAACSPADTAPQVEPTGIAAEVSDVVCESAPTTKTKSSTASTTAAPTKESWQCKRDDENIKFDIYPSASAKEAASKDALSLFGTVGGNQSWEMEPILCGATWTMSVADIETRDSIIAEFNTKGIAAATC